MVERKLALIFRAAHFFVIWYDMFSLQKIKKNALIFFDRENFDLRFMMGRNA